MRLLADAHVSRIFCGFLEAAGHDCAQSELLTPAMSDEVLLNLAVVEKRVILTAEKDFGELVFRRLLAVPGVILLRLRAPTEAERLSLF
jgi:predicted nuclease of predicted toxin-antitoxin system